MEKEAMGELVPNTPFWVSGEEQDSLVFEYVYLAWFWHLH